MPVDQSLLIQSCHVLLFLYPYQCYHAFRQIHCQFHHGSFLDLDLSMSLAPDFD